MSPLVSIIIPCYNHGRYLPEALESIKQAQGKYSLEIIITNDGSTEPLTIEILSDLGKKGYNILHQTNQGLAAARNNAIQKAKGKYILPLDSDNKVHENYLSKAVDILEQDNSIDVVYGNQVLFGEEEGIKRMKIFRFEDMVEWNEIDACALFRKTIWEKTNGYDGNMPAMGNEDWEFWIHVFLTGGRFYFLDDIGFYYRCLSDSMSVTTTRPGWELNKKYIHRKHLTPIISHLASRVRDLSGRVEYTDMHLKNHKIKSIAKVLFGRKI